MMPASVSARVTRATCATVTPFCIALEQPIGRDLEAAAQRHAARARQQLRQLGREGLLEADVAPPGAHDLARDQALGERAQPGRRRRLVDEVKAGLPGLGDQRLDAIDQQVGRRPGRSARCSRA